MTTILNQPNAPFSSPGYGAIDPSGGWKGVGLPGGGALPPGYSAPNQQFALPPFSTPGGPPLTGPQGPIGPGGATGAGGGAPQGEWISEERRILSGHISNLGMNEAGYLAASVAKADENLKAATQGLLKNNSSGIGGLSPSSSGSYGSSYSPTSTGSSGTNSGLSFEDNILQKYQNNTPLTQEEQLYIDSLKNKDKSQLTPKEQEILGAYERHKLNNNQNGIGTGKINMSF